MINENVDLLCEQLDKELCKRGLSRRDALKLAGVGTASFLLNPSEASAATKAVASDVKGKIVIVGGGAAGCSIASLLVKKLSNPNITIIEPNATSVSYQPGQTLIGAGVWQKEDILGQSQDFFPSEAKWMQDSVIEFDPDKNRVITAQNGEVKYDFLVVATGLQLNYDKIDGLSRDIIGSNGIGSVYFADGAAKTWPLMQKFVSEAKSGKKVEGVFTHPNTPIKCGGAPKKIMYLTNARLVEAKARDNATLTFYPNGGKMFGVPEYHEAIVKQFEARDMKWHYKHNLVAVDPGKKIATFDHSYLVKGEWDPDLEEFDMIPQVKQVKVPFDFMHVTPPMSAPDAVKKSPLAWQRGSASKGGWVELKKETLQHTRYANVFGLGDVAGIPMGKTGGSVRKQYTVAAQNLVDVMSGKAPTQKYGGYTVCPLITDIGTVMLAEFDWSKKPTPSFPLDPTKERWIWWILKVYMLKPMYFYGMLKGRA
ncbi:NAD(P)/FAD-dependent oxidoreductase [Sulfurospirillum arcachonense]|uniref:NAD(P)/FAD-dependent oxidoreductase n=1 Tax=Sulfurospirillum arcachonense TaxID=57666 RepID=UPI0004689A04|nr:FAD/NAD(P)-binding oxidoreductase [Sulfurospirillum arcachonense]